jgi:arabinofuranan 3-O-arabinosyltransferase
VGIGELRGAGVRAPAEARPALRLAAGCALSVRGARGTGRLAPVGTVGELEAGRPLRARGCGRLPLPAGPTRLETSSGDFRIDLLRLRSPAPVPPDGPRGGGSVVDPGTEGRGHYDGVRVAPRGPSWLVLGESYNRGWKAWCDGRSLGGPRVVDGFANGWQVSAGCRTVRIAYGPNRVAKISYWASALVCLLLVALLVVTRGRRIPRPSGRPAWASPAALRSADRPLGLPLSRAVAVGLAAGAVLGFLFALRAGAVLGPLVAIAVWRGVGARALIAAAGAVLVLVVPLVYLLFPPGPTGDFQPDYAVRLIGAHWLALAACVALAGALWLTLTSRGGEAT